MDKNSLGGNMPQSRLDAIKASWMHKYGTTEQDWDVFQQQEVYRDNSGARVKSHGTTDHEFDSFEELASKMEFIFCPDEREMGWRYRTKADHFRRLAEKRIHDNPVQAADLKAESIFWSNLSDECFEKSNDNRRKL